MQRLNPILTGGFGIAALALTLATTTPATASPDLDIIGGSFTNPVEPGGAVAVELTARNAGDALALGTDTSDSGYMIDFVLSIDDQVPAGFTPFSATFGEDVLLRGGRISNTRDLAPGELANYAETGLLPVDTPPGEYQLCLVIDPGDEIAETDETNNTYCQSLTVAWAQPDLTIIAASVPRTVAPGGAVAVEVTAYNMGNAAALGTEASDEGYMIDLVLSTDDHVPAGFTPFSETFGEDVLLKAGRISNTHDLAPHADRLYAETAFLPADTPPGEYQLCLVVDPGDEVAEADETNNTLCQSLTVELAAPIPTGIEQASWGRIKASHDR